MAANDSAKRLAFSFEYLDITNPKFSLDSCDIHFFRELLARMKALSQFDRNQFISLQATGKSWRVHRIDWLKDRRLSESSLGLHQSLTADELAWQFTISKRNGRVHGFLSSSTFFVRWLDRNHRLYGGDPD